MKKYGGGLVCLTLDDDGIPADAAGRLAIAEKIIRRAEALGIPRRELLVDGLTMPVSAGGDNGRVTLETLRRAKAELGVKTALGVSNVSFGLPQREVLNQSFFTMALQAGLDGAIINPKSRAMLGAYHAYRALMGLDDQCQTYMTAFQEGGPGGPRPGSRARGPGSGSRRPSRAGARGAEPTLPRGVQRTEGRRRRPGQASGGERTGHFGHHQRRARFPPWTRWARALRRAPSSCPSCS